MKVYEASTLFDTMSTRKREYETLREQLITLKKAFQNIVDLDEALKGRGADAIKGFYRAQLDVLTLWLQLVDRNIAFLSEIPEGAAYRSLENETVELHFLEGDLSNSERRSKEMIREQQEDLQRIFDRISDIQPLHVFSRNEVDHHLEAAEREREKTIESVEQLDEELTSKYTMLESDEQILAALFGELMNASTQGNQVSSLYYNAASFHSSDVYSAIAASQMESTTLKKEQTSQEVASQVEENENPFIESVNSFKEIGSDLWGGYQERGDKKMDSLYDFGNYLTSGLFDGVRGTVNAMDERSDKAMDSPYDFVNYLTSGGADLLNASVNPEDDFSKEHWMSSLGLASLVSGVKLGRTIKSNAPIIESNISRKPNNGKKGNPKNEINNLAELMKDDDAKRYHQFWDYVDKELSITDRVKLMNWNYKPTGELYNRYKPVYDDLRYYDQNSGNINWPGQNGDPNSGGFIDGYYKLEKLQPGNVIDRYGSNNNGQYFSPIGYSYESRALPPHMINQPYNQYIIKQEFTVHSGRVAPWFNEVGEGIQYHSKIEILDDFGELKEATVQNLIEYGYLEPIDRTDWSD